MADASGFQLLYLWFDETVKPYTVFVTDRGSYLKVTSTSIVPPADKYRKGIYSEDNYIGRHNCKRLIGTE